MSARNNCHSEPPYTSGQNVCADCGEPYDKGDPYSTDLYCADCKDWRENEKAERR